MSLSGIENKSSLSRGGHRRVFFALLLPLVWLALTSNSSTSNPQQKFLEKFQEERKKVKTYAARFEQKKNLALFDEEKRSSGKLLFKAPHQMIWKYETPDKTQMLVTNKVVSFYFPSLEQIEVYRMNQGKGAAPFFFAFEATVEELKENFTISGPSKDSGLNRVELVPKTEPLASEAKSIVLWLSEKDYVPRKVLIAEVTGDTTEITFSNIEINRPISDKELQLDAPEGTEIIEGDKTGL